MKDRLSRRNLLGVLLLGLAGCAPPGVAPSPAPAEAATTVVAVRHAERAQDPPNDPGLSAEGVIRARALPAALHSLGAEPVAAIYSTQFRRTQETVAPLAAQTGVTVTERPISAANLASYAQDLAREIRSRHTGETVVIVGHSNTVPALVAALSGGPAPQLAETDYGDLFRVIIPASGPPRVERSRFGR